MTTEAETPPPKETWPTYRLNVKSIDLGYFVVRAPDAESARHAAERWVADGMDMTACQIDPNDGWFEVGEDPAEVVKPDDDDFVPFAEYDPEHGYAELDVPAPAEE